MHVHPTLALSLALLSTVLATSYQAPLEDEIVRRSTPETYQNGTSTLARTTRRHRRAEAVANGLTDLKQKKRSCKKRTKTIASSSPVASTSSAPAAKATNAKAYAINPKADGLLSLGLSIDIFPTPTATVSASAPSATSTASSPFKLTQDYSGSTFMDGWDFFDYPDPTHGQVNYLGASDAYNRGLLYTTATNSTVLRVDDSSWLAPGAHRDSVRITSKETFSEGSLVIFDANKMPYGPSTWPAFWSVGTNWPAGGEIDIVEQVHDATQNQMTLHTTAGCTLAEPMAGTGSVLETTCDAAINGNTGCGVRDNGKNSFGSTFNAVGGGVFAMHWDAGGISIWSFERSSIPSDISAGAPAFDNWGQPSARWSASTCSMDYFGPQTLVFDITLCGDWAGPTFSDLSGLSGSCSQAVQNPNNFKNALFDINYVKIYSPK